MNFTPYLLFDGNCAEAMTFYQSCLGGELSLMKVSESPMKDFMPPQVQDRILNARLRSGVIDFSATDWLHPTRVRKQGNTICLYLSEGSYDELKDCFDRLGVGAEHDLLDPLTKQPFGFYGALTDKYGVRWMFHGSSD